jgi:hypothetical protein
MLSRFAANAGLMFSKQAMKLYMFMQMFVLLLLLFCCVCNFCSSTVPDNSTDVLSLLEFKRAANDPQGALSN